MKESDIAQPDNLIAQGGNGVSCGGAGGDPERIPGVNGENSSGEDVSLTGEIGGRSWSAGKDGFGNSKGEYDAIIRWENPIAIELGEYPRFKHG